jgi:isocitrate lyase
LKERKKERKNISHIFFVSGSPSSATTNLRDRNIPTVGTYSLERIPEYASHLSNSVSEQPSQQISDDMVFGEEQMTNILARARTFDDRWPHRHLNPGDMARAGFFFTGKFQKYK